MIFHKLKKIQWRSKFMDQINLLKDPGRFVELPRTVKIAMGCLLGAWIAHFVFLFTVSQGQLDRHLLFQHLALAVMSCFFVAKLKNWARIVCMAGNCIALVQYVDIVYRLTSAAKNFGLPLFLALATMVLFAAATVYLFIPQSAEFFKLQSVKPSPPASD
jgi:hypothetical protein